ncbi:MAG: type II toxin-antitoxin system HicB family antitoxin [Clostridia bacterium]|nr:type II toxin-antitoxin system HicB family antitoxin [Clostridia bacterium]
MKTIAVVERGKDGSYGIYTPNLENTISGNGKTLEDAKRDFEEALQEIPEVFAAMGEPVPDELRNLEFEYQYDIASFYEAHPYLNVSQVARYIGMNDTLMRQYRRGQYISEVQIARIQDGIHRIGRELSNVELIK